MIFRLDYVEMLQWHDFGEAYERGFRRLLEAIETARTSPQKVWRYRRWDERLQPFDFADFLFTQAPGFLRPGVAVRRRSSDGEPSPIGSGRCLITGDPGIGKSAIVAQLIHANAGGQVLAHHCCQFRQPRDAPARPVHPQPGGPDRQPGRGLRRPARRPQGRGRARRGPLPRRSLQRVRGRHPRPLARPACPARRRPLHPDRRARRGPGPPRGTIVVDSWPPGSTACPAGCGWWRPRGKTPTSCAGSAACAEEIKADDPRNLDDVERFLAHRLGQPKLRARLDRSRVSAEQAIGRLRDKSGGNFLWVQQALLGLESDAYGFDQLEELPPGLTGLYGDFFERHFPDEAAYAPARRCWRSSLPRWSP